MRFIVVIHYQYDCTEPAIGDGTDESPVVSYPTREEAQQALELLEGPKRDLYIWAVE